MERGALVVERERVAGLADQRIELPVRKFERPKISADAPRHFVDGQAVGGNRVPEAEEGNVIDRALVLVVLGGNEEVAQLSEHPFDLKPRFEVFRPVRPVGHCDLSIEFLFGLVTHQPLFADQPVHHADGECAAAEPECEDVVALPGAVSFRRGSRPSRRRLRAPDSRDANDSSGRRTCRYRARCASGQSRRRRPGSRTA